jgi:hypothetical protein
MLGSDIFLLNNLNGLEIISQKYGFVNLKSGAKAVSTEKSEKLAA